MSVHAKLSASGSKKWLNCPASVELESHFTDETSVYAQEGTFAHQLAEIKIKLHFKKGGFSELQKQLLDVKKSIQKEDFNFNEIDKYTENFKDYVVEVYNSYLGSDYIGLFIEERLDYSKYAKDGFGTGDIVILTDKNLHIIDLKYGKGIKVDAQENTQLMMYGLGGLSMFEIDLLELDIKTVKMTIYQPRIDNISEFEMAKCELIDWGVEVVKPLSELALQTTNLPCAGNHCDEGFCKAKAVCKAYNNRYLDLQKYEFKHPQMLTNDEIANVLSVCDTLKKWGDTVKTYALDKMLQGLQIHGYKVVEGKSLRKINDEEKAIKLLKEAGFKKSDYLYTKIATIPKLETLLGKKNFYELLGDIVEKPKGAPTIALNSDKRVEYNSPQGDFADFNYSQ